ncbi:MAG: hypothetical protein ACM3SO_21695, partial [Betaproteobacteria bacterium]
MNALFVQPGGTIIAAGGLANGGGTYAALVRYDAMGQRDLAFGTDLFGAKRVALPASESQLRAVADWGNGGFVAAGYWGSASAKYLLIAAFTAEGDLDPAFANGAGWTSPAQGDAFGITAIPGASVLAVGRDQHAAFGHEANNVVLAKTDASGQWDFAFGNNGVVSRAVFLDEMWDASAGGVSAYPLPNGDVVAGGTVTRASDGHGYFFTLRVAPASGGSTLWTTPAPRTAADDRMAGAFSDGAGRLVALGTRTAADGERLLRLRYGEENGLVDPFIDVGGTSTDPFVFPPVDRAAAATQYTSAAVTIAGNAQPVAIGVSNGSYSIGCIEPFTSEPGTVSNGQQVCVRVVSASAPSTPVTALLTVGNVQATFSVTTGTVPDTSILSAPPDPSASFVTFYYAADESVSGPAIAFECHVDSNPYAQCPMFTNIASHANFGDLAVGVHTFEVRAINAWGTDATPATYTWTVIAPADTTITSHPADPTTATSATFSFGSTEPSATFECSIDSTTAYSGCVSPRTYTNLAGGSHTFRARAIDVAGTGWPAQYSWTIDNTPPETFITSGPASPTASAAATFAYSYTDNVGLAATFECSVDNGAWTACPGGSVTVTVGGGTHTMAIRAVDAAGNVDPTPATRTWTVDATPPETTITSGPSGTVASRSGTFTYSSEAGATFECSLDGGAFAACSGAGFSFGSLPDGVHAFGVRARDSVGNVDATPATASWTIDMPPPDTTITQGTNGTVTTTDAIFYFASDDPTATFECSMDGLAFQSCRSPVQYAFLSQGAHTFQVRARTSSDIDASPAQRSFVVDSIAPDTTIGSAPGAISTSTSASISFSSNEPAATFQCALDGAAWTGCASPATYAALALGSHSFQVRAIDPAGNIDASPASTSWTVVDGTPPETAFLRTPEAATPSTTAQFDWASNESGVSYEYRLDAAAWTPTTGTTRIYTGLPEGTHTFDVRAIDAAGNIDATPASWTWTIDSTAPDSTILAGPQASSNVASATFTFTSNETGSTFLCSVDADPMTACTSPITYGGLADGAHQFNVLARDAAGNWEQQGSLWQWTIDTSAPDTSITSGPSGTVAQPTASFTFSATDATATFECALDSAPFGGCASGIAYGALADGMHLFEVRARDTAGNVDATPASRTWSVDTAAPNTTITQGPDAIAAATSATFAFTASEGATFQCKLDAGPYGGCTSPQSYAALSSAAHTFSVYAIDAAGNVDGSAATWSWIVDAVAPDTSITSGPSGTVAQNGAAFAFASTETGSTFECRVDGAAFAACASPFGLSGLSDGAHLFEVRAIDAAGNMDASPAGRSWTVDTTAPDTIITASPGNLVNTPSASISFASEAGATFECRLDAGAFTACTSPAAYAGLADGSHTFQVRARDAAGNTDATPASFAWTVDTVAPDTTITGGPSGNNNPATATFTFTSTETPAQFECKLDAGAFTACASPQAYNNLPRGSHTFQVRAIDAAGNVDATAAGRTWKSN